MSLNNTQIRALQEPQQNLAGVEGVEPANAGIKIRCLNQLGDTPTRDSCLMFYPQATNPLIVKLIVKLTIYLLPTL